MEKGITPPEAVAKESKLRRVGDAAIAIAAGTALSYGVEKSIKWYKKRREIKREKQSRERMAQPVPKEKGDRGQDFAAFTNLPEDVQALFGSEEAYREGMGKIEDRVQRYAEGLVSQLPETEQFKHEIESPKLRSADIPTYGKDFNYAVYNLNQGSEGRPIVVNLGWSVGADSRIGRPFLQALCNKTDRPIIVIDPIGTGKTSNPTLGYLKEMNYASMAESEKQVLDQELEELQADSFDVVGISQGGIRGKNLAALYGDRVRKLVTVGTPGFNERSLGEMRQAFLVDEAILDKAIREKGDYNFTEQNAYYDDLYTNKFSLLGKFLPTEMLSPRRLPTLLRMVNMMRLPVMQDTSRVLAPETQWTDLIGSKDHVTDYRPHLAAVRARNAEADRNRYRHNSRLHLLTDASHAYTNPQPTTMAEDISQLLADRQRVAA